MVLVIATAGLVYELVMAAVASYVLGDSVRQFSIIIGVYLSALGFGAYLSRFVERHLELAFVDVELGAALIGGLSAPGLFVAFSFTDAFHLVLYSTVLAVGVLVGLELPLLIRILQRDFEFKELIAKALTFDYAGALLGSLGFSLLLVPNVGLVHASLVCGLLNAFVGLCATWLLAGQDAEQRRTMRRARVRACVVIGLLALAALNAHRVTALSEAHIFSGQPVVATHSAYQRILLTEHDGTLRLFLNGNLQFSSVDEHRYHEALVHPAMASAKNPRRVLVGGGGDGLAARELLKWPGVESITVVDLDPAITELAATHPALVELNRGALSDERVRVVNTDAMVWISETDERYDVIVLDFPDPSNYSLGKLYSQRFYQRARKRLMPGGALAVQSTSPLFARRAYWCVVETLQSVGFHVHPYHVFVPSFGDWGYVLATLEPQPPPSVLAIGDLRYLSSDTLHTLFQLPSDMTRVAADINRLNNQALVGYYLDEWSRFN